MTQNKFNSLQLSSDMLANLDSLEYKEMTPIQAQSLPFILQGKDVLAKAKTGSGKTAAFGIGLLEKLDVKNFNTQSLVICPTRELADQVAKELRRLARATHNVKILTLCGGVSIGPQLGSLERGAHIVVGTPGRLLDHIEKKSLDLSRLNQLVLDEADRMLDMGFADDMKKILAACPLERQTLLFSATYPKEIAQLSADYQRDAQVIEIESAPKHEQIEQHFFKCDAQEDKANAITQLLSVYAPESTLIFCNTKLECDELCAQLKNQQWVALSLHGDMEQRERNQVLVRFANRSCSILIATDVAARGLDIQGLDAVINVGLAHDPEVHVHRIGRTGRAGEKGLALSLIAERDFIKLKRLEDYLQTELKLDILPNQSKIPTLIPSMTCLELDGGKKDKLRPADIVGALTKDAGFAFDDIGKIDTFDFCTFVAVKNKISSAAFKFLTATKIKNKKFRVRKL